MIKIKTDFRAVNRMLKGLKKELGKGKNGAKAGYVKGQPRKPGDGETSAPATMDEVALFNEFGTATIPPRPFLRNAQKKAAERGGEIVQSGLNAGLSMGAIMKNVAEGLQNLIVESIEDNIPPPNAESTVAKKGSSHTLIDTSQLRASVRRASIVHALDCAICAAIDFNVANGAINFNFQPATGYTPITTLGTVVDYQQGKTNMSLAEELDSLCISYVYSVGFGEQEQVLYGMGLMQGSFGTEDVQVNESWLENDLQTRIMNGFISLEKLKLQGTDARDFMASIIATSFEQGQTNGAIAYNGTLSDTDRNSIVTATGNSAAADSVADNGYYYQIQELTAEDIAARRVRILVCYLCGGVVNKVVITNRIYGA